jgi:hypothetical protein
MNLLYRYIYTIYIKKCGVNENKINAAYGMNIVIAIATATTIATTNNHINIQNNKLCICFRFQRLISSGTLHFSAGTIKQILISKRFYIYMTIKGHKIHIDWHPY